MKKTIFYLFAFAAIVSVSTSCNNQKSESVEATETKKDSSIVVGSSNPENRIKVAYFDMARFALEYTPAVKAMENLRNEQAKSGREFQSRQAALEKEAAQFQEKMNNNAFLSQASAESQYNELQRKSQKLQQDYDRKLQELSQKSQHLEQQYADTLLNYLKEFNAQAQYELIIDRAAVLLAVEGYDVTDEIIANLNARVANKE